MNYKLATAAYYNIHTFESRTKALLAMIRDKLDPFPERTALRIAVEALADSAKARNIWVHGLWVTYANGSVTKVFNMKQASDKRRATQVTANAVRQHVKAVREKTKEIEALCPTKIALLRTSQEK
jgi:hypothetical protein